MRRVSLAIVVLVCLSIPAAGLAKIGVGISTGKIQVEEPLKAGGVYELPPLVVINTGDEPSSYGVSVEYHANIPELRPDRAWFQFTPSTFELQPGAVQKVAIQLILPVKTQPGDYFAYMEAHPVQTQAGSGGAQIGIAAAAKLNFSIAPANLLQGLYWRFLYFWNTFTPWTYIALIVVVGAVLLLVARRFVSLNVGLRKKDEAPLGEIEGQALTKPPRKRAAGKAPTKTKKK